MWMRDKVRIRPCIIPENLNVLVHVVRVEWVGHHDRLDKRWIEMLIGGEAMLPSG
jgi:hypothetical protein